DGGGAQDAFGQGGGRRGQEPAAGPVPAPAPQPAGRAPGAVRRPLGGGRELPEAARLDGGPPVAVPAEQRLRGEAGAGLRRARARPGGGGQRATGGGGVRPGAGGAAGRGRAGGGEEVLQRSAGGRAGAVVPGAAERERVRVPGMRTRGEP